MSDLTTILCRLYIPQKYYQELPKKLQSQYDSDDFGFYYMEFPAPVSEQSYLGEYIIAFCEAALIIPNPIYEIDSNSDLSCELLKLGRLEDTFNLLITIHYPGSSKEFHDILLFKEREQSLGFYSFELLGDQKIFST